MSVTEIGGFDSFVDALEPRIIDMKTSGHGYCYDNDFDVASSTAKTLIRRAKQADFARLLAIDQSSFPPGVSYDSSELSYFMKRTNAETIVLEQDGEIAAFLIAEMNVRRSIATMITLDVLRKFRRLGYGSRLLRRSEEMLVRKGVKRYELQVDVENRAAIQFYMKHGFRQLGTLKHYYANGHDAYVMAKTLPASAEE